MTHTDIDRQSVPPNLLPQVERLAKFTDGKLQVFESYDIEVRWSGASALETIPSIHLRLGVRDDAGRMRWDEDRYLSHSFFTDSDEGMQQRVGEIVFRFIDLLHQVSRDHIRGMQERLRLSEPVTVEG